MSLEQAKSLIRIHRIVPNKLMGQNFLVDASIYQKLASYAALSLEDTVLDAGAGLGFLTQFLSAKCKQVIAVEKDPKVAAVLREQVKALANVTIIEGDVLKVDLPSFNKTISIPPYYLSSNLVIWLIERRLDCAVLIQQKEFADRLVAPVGSEDYGWLAVTAYQAAKVELLDSIPKWMFHPPPEVDSVIVVIKPWVKPQFNVKDQKFFRRMLKCLFTERNKKLENAAAPFIRSELKLNKTQASELAKSFPQRDKRIRELAPEDFGEIADGLYQ
jgi:16S rRNA (adenine1518-N6/adenine1519-N6)-dimethyltransferase